MKLNELYNKPLKEVLETLDLADMKVHTDDNKDIRAIELRYEDNPDKSNKEKEDNRYGGSSKVFG